MVFTDSNSTLRTDESFATKQQPNHHVGRSPLTELDIGLVSKFPHDPMHLVYLCVMRRLLYRWKGKDSQHLGKLSVKDRLRLNAFEEKNHLAKTLLISFVERSVALYGKDFQVYNVHSLLHLPDDALEFGPLHTFSAFPFENHMQSLKAMIRKKNQYLQQVVKRTIERRMWNKPSPATLKDKELKFQVIESSKCENSDLTMTIAVIPTSWLHFKGENEYCWWPQDCVKRHILFKSIPEKNWSLFALKFIHYSRTHASAQASLRFFECHTDIEFYSEDAEDASPSLILPHPLHKKTGSRFQQYEINNTIHVINTCWTRENFDLLARPRSVVGYNSENSNSISTMRPVAIVNPLNTEPHIEDEHVPILVGSDAVPRAIRETRESRWRIRSLCML
ncbi:hypothetical protein JTE90_029260 [Oedothorax gibbosus]|uniref:DUF4218 domain-containing protein n=1 Tax=Oedothorax gibbosus TaxID=931172 RepID=A0AAV6TWF0_9ARAC|nr:hypothetical protein JTE90_029260 [Oedothorax gibbosus]